MNRLIFQTVLTVALLGVSTGSLKADEQETAKQEKVEGLAFFPMNQGDSWVYKTTRKKSAPQGKEEEKDDAKPGETFDMEVKVDGTWEDDGESGVILRQKDKRGQMREFLLTNEKGIFIKKLGLKKGILPEVFSRFNPAVPRVIFPLIPNTKVHWEGRLKVATINRQIIFDGVVQDFEEVTVPAGKFRCIKLFYDQKRGDEKVQETAWYAEGVGQVKYNGGQYTKELKSYEVK